MSNPAVAVRRCQDYSYPVVKQIVGTFADELRGGWRELIPAGATVLLKPNLLKPAFAHQAVSPHPAVVRAVAECCRDAGAGKIIIGDSPGFGTAEKVAGKCGIAGIADELGIEVVNFTDSVTVHTPKQFVHRFFTIAREAAEADVIINLPKFKTHAMMVLTLAVKNLYGVLVGRQKARWHFQSGRDYDHFARLLLELAHTVKPAFTVLDAVIGMEGNGPGSGTPRPLGFLAASVDMTALDRIAADIAGIDPESIYTLRVAAKMGYATDLKDITVLGDPPDSLRIDDLAPAAHMQVDGPAYIRPLTWLLRHVMTTKPSINAHACEGCGICITACPAHCIVQPLPDLPVKINHSACIRCFCCQELCPEGAISAVDAPGVKILKALKFE